MSTMNINGYGYDSYSSYAGTFSVSFDGESKSPDGKVSGFDKKSKSPDGQVSGFKEECQTCKKRKYQDGSDESNVSFKSAAHISPEAAGASVRAHEQQHVSNAYKKAAANNGTVVRASVSIHMEICPECGRSYVSGGTTSTQIKYYNEENPYQKDLKATDGVKYRGMNVNMTA